MASVACRADLWYNRSLKYHGERSAGNTSQHLRSSTYSGGQATMSDIIPQKRCSTCNNFFPATPEHFKRDKNRADGLYPQCKICNKVTRANPENKEYARAYKAAYYANPENKKHKLEHDRAYYLDHKDKVNQQNRAWHEAHYEEARQQWKAYRERPEVQEYRKNYGKAYRETHKHEPEWKARKLAHVHARRARILGNSGTHTPQQLQEQLQRQKGKCYYCHTKLDKWHADHVIPLVQGGSNDISNIVIACPSCNQRKQAKLWRLL